MRRTQPARAAPPAPTAREAPRGRGIGRRRRRWPGAHRVSGPSGAGRHRRSRGELFRGHPGGDGGGLRWAERQGAELCAVSGQRRADQARPVPERQRGHAGRHHREPHPELLHGRRPYGVRGDRPELLQPGDDREALRERGAGGAGRLLFPGAGDDHPRRDAGGRARRRPGHHGRSGYRRAAPDGPGLAEGGGSQARLGSVPRRRQRPAGEADRMGQGHGGRALAGRRARRGHRQALRRRSGRPALFRLRRREGDARFVDEQGRRAVGLRQHAVLRARRADPLHRHLADGRRHHLPCPRGQLGQPPDGAHSCNRHDDAATCGATGDTHGASVKCAQNYPAWQALLQ